MIAKVSAHLKSRQPDTGIVVQKAKVSDKDNIDAAPQFKMQYTLREDEEDSRGQDASDSGNGNQE